MVRTPVGRRGGPKRLAVLIARRWPASGVRLTVKFMDNPPKDLRARILLHMNAWGKTANVQFTETRGSGKVRLARLDSPPDMAGYWSWIGTEILEIPDRRADAQPRGVHDDASPRRNSTASCGTKPVIRSGSSTSTCAGIW